MNFLKILKKRNVHDIMLMIVILIIVVVFSYEIPYKYTVDRVKTILKDTGLLEKAFNYDINAEHIESVNDRIIEYYSPDNSISKVKDAIKDLQMRFTTSGSEICLEKRVHLTYAQIVNILATLEKTKVILIKHLDIKNVLNMPILQDEETIPNDEDVELNRLDFEIVSTTLFNH